MNEIAISDKISYIESTENPLSADIGIIRDNGIVWLYDVGNNEERLPRLDGSCNVVLSHFHQDHTGCIDRLNINRLYASGETSKRVGLGDVVSEDIIIGNIRIFPIPSSHCKGCLGLETDDGYAFVGDALYCKVRNDHFVYNAQLLKEEIEVLKKISAPFLLVSHHKGLVRGREEVISELKAIYEMRTPESPDIMIKRG